MSHLDDVQRAYPVVRRLVRLAVAGVGVGKVDVCGAPVLGLYRVKLAQGLEQHGLGVAVPVQPHQACPRYAVSLVTQRHPSIAEAARSSWRGTLPCHEVTRAIAALALSERTGLPPTTASASVTDHPKDGGIDGVAYAADRAALVFVQSKWTEGANTGISQGDVMKFVGGVRRVVNGDWSGFGGPILDRHAEIEDILEQTGTKIEIVVVTSGTWDLADEPKRELEEFCSQMNDSTEIASYVYLNQERLYAMLTATRAAQIDLSVKPPQLGKLSGGRVRRLLRDRVSPGGSQVVPGPRRTPLLP